MFIYCFDEKEKNKLEKQLKLLQESCIDNKQCWIFIIDGLNGINKFSINNIDKSKCIVSDRLRF
jgi:hypothetical protein